MAAPRYKLMKYKFHLPHGTLQSLPVLPEQFFPIWLDSDPAILPNRPTLW